MQCDDGDIRVSGYAGGRVIMCLAKRWVAVCGYADDRLATVVCRLLGYDNGKCKINYMYVHVCLL